MKRTIVAAVAVAGLALGTMSCTGGGGGPAEVRATPDADPAPAASTEPKPEPTITIAEFRSQRVGRNRIRVWPRSEEVPDEGVYRYTVPHCGLEWMTDFDGSFWEIVDPESYGKRRPSFFINSDQGTLAFEDGNTLSYRASTGEEVKLRRLPGPTIIHPCG